MERCIVHVNHRDCQLWIFYDILNLSGGRQFIRERGVIAFSQQREVLLCYPLDCRFRSPERPGGGGSIHLQRRWRVYHVTNTWYMTIMGLEVRDRLPERPERGDRTAAEADIPRDVHVVHYAHGIWCMRKSVTNSRQLQESCWPLVIASLEKVIGNKVVTNKQVLLV